MKSLRALLVFVIYLGIAVLITYPLVLRMSDGFAGFPYGDAYEIARHMWWMTHALRTGEPLFFQPLLAYPDGIPGLTLQATPLMLFPGWLFALFIPLPAAYNLHLLLTLAFNGWAMFAFARALTGRRDAAFLAGVVFMSYPTLQGHLGASHLNLVAQWGLPLYAWALWRLTQEASPRSGAPTAILVVGAALAFVAVAWAHTIQLIYALIPITAFFALPVLWRRNFPALIRIGLGAGLGAALTLLWLLPTFASAFSSAYADEGGAVRYSADLLAAITPSFFHPLWGHLPHTRAVLGINLDEGAGYVGLIAGGLALVGIWRRREARSWFWLALVVYVLALGPLVKWNDQPVQFASDGYLSTIALPWALLERLPGVGDLARTPGRFNLTTGFAVAIMAAYGAAWLLARARRRAVHAALVVGCAGLILFDYQTFFPLPTTRADIPQAVYDLRQRDDARAVLDIPWDNLLAAKDALYLQTAHQLPMVAGHVTRRTPVDPAKLTILETTLDPTLLDLAGADIIIVHKLYVDAAELARIAERLGSPLYEDERFTVFQRPPADDQQRSVPLIRPDGARAFLYAPEDMLVMLDLRLTGGSGHAEMTLSDQRLWAGELTGDLALRLPVLVPAGYSTLTLTTDVPILFTFIRDVATTPGVSASFEDGIRLEASRIVARGDTLGTWLIWNFTDRLAPDTIRFVHLLDSEGDLVAQADSQPGNESEIVTLNLPETLPPGEFRVVVGWYRLPDVTPIGDSVEIGRIQLP